MSEPKWTVVAPLRPRFRDTDAMGHINNAVYVTYLEVARQEYWRAFKDDENYRVVPFILARVEIDFRSEALMHETLDLCIRCSFIGGKSFGFDYEIREQKTRRLVVKATSVQVFYDYAAKASIPCPPEMRARFEAFEGRALAR
ncbi:MAG: acyl-CoA thioesterase [Candidatus Eisenbacteria bacterium]|uniref:Acyl-CoA thioesterase n=1 Tax=Eiseniibacteriota bacterium TaxID=2212470 RepID=A0A933SB92_UNCEI|nr:acyl-CoA thioesterase [Candidatus Eisenbacteria bacterium]